MAVLPVKRVGAFKYVHKGKIAKIFAFKVIMYDVLLKINVMKCFVSSHIAFVNIYIFPALFELRNRIKIVPGFLYFCKTILLVLRYRFFHHP